MEAGKLDNTPICEKGQADVPSNRGNTSNLYSNLRLHHPEDFAWKSSAKGEVEVKNTKNCSSEPSKACQVFIK